MDFKEVTTTEIKFMNKEEYYAWFNVKAMLGDLIAFETSNGRPMGDLCFDAEEALGAMRMIEAYMAEGYEDKDEVYTHEEAFDEFFDDEDDYDDACVVDHALDLLRNDLDMVDEDEDEDEEENEQTVYKVYIKSYEKSIVPKCEYLGGSVNLAEAIQLGLDHVRGEGWQVDYERYFNDENGKGMNIDYGAWDSYIWITPAPEPWWHSWNGEKEEND